MSSSSSDSTGQSRSATSTTTSVTDRATASSTPSPGTNLATSAEQNASSLWREFQDVTKKIFRHRRMYDEIERTMERQSAMEAKVQEQQDRISNLESNQQSQLHSFEKRYDTWKQEKVRLESEKKKAEGEMTAEHTRKMEDMKQQLRRETGRADFLAKEQERAKKEANLAKNELEVCKSRLQFWECHTSRLKDVNFDSLEKRMTRLFRDCFDLLDAHFSVDLPSPLVSDYAQWKKQVNELNLPLKFPPTNSRAAKRVRVAAALHIIATRLCANIFKPCYIPESAAGSEIIKQILQDLSRAQLQREEQFTRAVLTFMYPPDQVRAAIDVAVRTTLDDVLKQLGIFLVDDKGFPAALEALLQDAAGLWQELQQSKTMVKASVEDEDSTERTDEYLPEFGEPISSAESQAFEMLSLFPRIYVPENGRVVHRGFFLWPDQEAVITAEQELKDFKAQKGARDGHGMNGTAVRGSKRERRQSAVISGEVGSIPSSPTSSRAGKLSFSEWETQRVRESVAHS